MKLSNLIKNLYQQVFIGIVVQNSQANVCVQRLKGKKLEKKFKELIEYINEYKNENPKYAVFSHVLFEHIHPFPDFNGRIGRLIYLWMTTADAPYVNEVSNMIKNHRNKYYQMIELSEKHHDLTFALIFFDFIISLNEEFYREYQDLESKYYYEYRDLNSSEQQMLFDMFSWRSMEFGWSEYKERFDSELTKQQIHNLFKQLEEKGFLTSKTYGNNLKRYKFK